MCTERVSARAGGIHAGGRPLWACVPVARVHTQFHARAAWGLLNQGTSVGDRLGLVICCDLLAHGKKTT